MTPDVTACLFEGVDLVAMVEAPEATPTIGYDGRTYTWEGGTTYQLTAPGHDHRCPTCDTVWQCPAVDGTACANRAHNGNPVWLCEACRVTGSNPAGGAS